MRIALISPKGPLYRHRGGIFKKSLRYAPLTLTTLAALVPAELNADVRIYDEGVEVIPEDLDVDPRRYDGDHRIGATLRRAGQAVPGPGHPPSSLAAPTSPWRRRMCALTPTCSSRATRRRHGPSSCVTYAPARSRTTTPKARTTASPGCLSPKREMLKRHNYTTMNVFEATRGCIHDCDFCVVPTAWGA
jgi:radical SAM superfamily enzyme YgiQ (UPF0313 family)